MTEEELREKIIDIIDDERDRDGAIWFDGMVKIADQILNLFREAGWKLPEEECVWTIEDEDQGLWETTCKNVFFLSDGVPLENDMIYCCYCGRKIKS